MAIMKSARIIKKNSGFTLIELMITIAIAMILMTLAIPSFSLMINNSKVTSSTNEFVSALNLARSEALKRSHNVSVCSSNANLSACENTNKNYAANGWLVFTDCNSNGSMATDADCDGDGTDDADTILKVFQSIESMSMTHASDTSAWVSFNLSGRVSGGLDDDGVVVQHSSSADGTDTGIKLNRVTVSRIGRVKSEKI